MVTPEKQKSICEKVLEHPSLRFTEAHYAFQCVEALFLEGVRVASSSSASASSTALADVMASFHAAFAEYEQDHVCETAFARIVELFSHLLFQQTDIKAVVFMGHDFVQPLERIVAKAAAEGQERRRPELEFLVTMLRRNVEALDSLSITAPELDRLRESGKVMCARAAEWDDSDTAALCAAIVAHRKKSFV
jgi:hypothetical protein